MESLITQICIGIAITVAVGIVIAARRISEYQMKELSKKESGSTIKNVGAR